MTFFWLGVKMNITVIVSKALNKENWKKGVNYLNKYGVKGFIRKLKHLSPDTDYNKWLFGTKSF